MKCKNCNNELYFNQQYCGNCGTKVENQNMEPNVDKKGQTVIFYLLLVLFFFVIIGGITLVVSNYVGFDNIFKKTTYHIVDNYEVAIPTNFIEVTEESKKYFKSDNMSFTISFLDVSYDELIKYGDDLISSIKISSSLTVSDMYEKNIKNRKFLIIEYNDNDNYSYITPINDNEVVIGAFTINDISINSALEIISDVCDSVREVDFNRSNSSNYQETIKNTFIN